MENQTLGKRIMQNRKRLHMTQEQLAERVGVSPQAVSKWENDISCPDISILPELASIFGISVDELLGADSEKTKKVYEAEIDDTPHDHRVHTEFEFSGRRNGIWFAVYVLCIGGLILLTNLARLDVSWWSIVWMTALLIVGLSGVTHRFSFFSLGLTLAGAYLLLSEFSVLRLNLGWGVVVPVFLLLWGVSLLADALRKKHRVYVDGHTRPSGTAREKKLEYACSDGWLDCDLSFGSHRVAVVEPLLRGGRIDSSFGNFTVDFSGCGALAENCHISVDNSFGSLVLLVPDRFAANVNRTDFTAASVNIKGQPASQTEGTITFDSDLSFGTMEIRYV